MDDDAIQLKYFDRVIEVAGQCSRKVRQASLLFMGIAFVLYFLTNDPTAELTLMGVTIAIPREGLLLLGPLVLSILIYVLSSYGSLEHEALREIRRLLNAEPEQVFEPWQYLFFENPSHYTFNELWDLRGKSDRLSRLRFFVDALVALLYTAGGPAVVGYFVYLGTTRLTTSWMFLSYALSIFFILFALAQFFEVMFTKKEDQGY